MPEDTYKTTYEVEKDETIDGQPVAGFVSTCDYCKSCEDESSGEDSLGIWKDGKTKIRFFPHISDDSQTPPAIRPTWLVNDAGELVSTVPIDPETNLPKPTLPSPIWKDGGGFYFKKITGAFHVTNHNSDSQKICNYLIEANWESSLDNQILNWFRGGPDRMAFVVVNRNTDKQSGNNAAHPTINGPQSQIQQYYHFLSSSGTVGGSGISGKGLSTVATSGKFFFKAKTYDTIWIEFYEYARRGYSQGWSSARELNTYEKNTLEVEYSNVADGAVWGDDNLEVYGPGFGGFGPVVNTSHDVDDHDYLYNFSIGKSQDQKTTLPNRPVQQDVQLLNLNGTVSPLKELRAMGAYARDYRFGSQFGGIGNFDDTDIIQNRYGSDPVTSYGLDSYTPATLGKYSVYDLNLGMADPINYDWVMGNYIDPTLIEEEAHNSVTVEFKKHLIVDPAFPNVPLQDSGLTNKGVAFAPYLESEVAISSDFSIQSQEIGRRGYSRGQRVGNRFTKVFAEDEAGQDTIAAPGELIHFSDPNPGG